MTDELYIDGLKCDMGADSGITLEYKSNLLSDISKIVSNYSYTIKLPATSRNKRIIKGANIVSANTQFPYIPHSAKVIRDGVEIVMDANAILLSASQETIEIALSWGNTVAFQQLAEFEGNIGDLAEVNEWVTWMPDAVKHGIEWAQINYGKKENIYHYTYPVSKILELMTNKFGVSIEYDKEKKSWIDKLIIPITSTEVPYDTLENTKANPYQLVWNADKNVHEFSYERVSPKDTECIRLNYPGTIIEGKYAGMGCDISVDFSVDILGLYVSDRGEREDIVIARKENDGNYTEVARITSLPRYLVDPYYRYEFKSVVTADDFYGNMVLLLPINKVIEYNVNNSGTVKQDIIFYPKPKSEYAPAPAFNRLYTNYNLPKVKPIDLLKTISSMLGVFAVPTNSNSIKMVSFDTVVNGKENAMDWSKKVITDVYSTAGTVSFKLDNYGQRNWLRYEEDDTVVVNADSYIECNNKTIEKDIDMVELPFAASDMIGEVASLPLYSYDQNAELQKEDISDRILIYDETKNIGTFKGLTWKELIQANYVSFQDVVRIPKIYSVSVKLTPVDLSVIDLTRPVYIQQAGAYFAIISIKTKQNYICDVQLLKI